MRVVYSIAGWGLPVKQQIEASLKIFYRDMVHGELLNIYIITPPGVYINSSNSP